MNKLFSPVQYLFILIFLLSGCGSVDLSLINEVKRFEPEWMNLSETVTFIERNLNLTQRRYAQDFREVEPYIKNPQSNQRNDLYGLRSQYNTMVEKRDELQGNFDTQKEDFVSTVSEFNDWVNSLMKNRLGEDEAYSSFKSYKEKHESLKGEMRELQAELIKNIQEHNAILKRITNKLKLYSNFDINPK
ncbi:MAG: hypothetical protein AAF696_10055 [Bacteroidota bacterium]